MIDRRELAVRLADFICGGEEQLAAGEAEQCRRTADAVLGAFEGVVGARLSGVVGCQNGHAQLLTPPAELDEAGRYCVILVRIDAKKDDQGPIDAEFKEKK